MYTYFDDFALFMDSLTSWLLWFDSKHGKFVNCLSNLEKITFLVNEKIPVKYRIFDIKYTILENWAANVKQILIHKLILLNIFSSVRLH